MHVEMVDLFRCLEPHEDSWLVAAAYETIDRVIVQGTLGCPVCGAEYPIVDGVAHFGPSSTHADTAPPAVDETTTLRLAAQLDLDAPGKVIALVGYGANDVLALQELVPTRVVLVNPADDAAVSVGDPIASIRCGPSLPLVKSSLHGLAVRGTELPKNCADVLRPGGRIVAPSWFDIVSGTNEIARDHEQWVATRDAVASPPVSLRRRQSSE